MEPSLQCDQQLLKTQAVVPKLNLAEHCRRLTTSHRCFAPHLHTDILYIKNKERCLQAKHTIYINSGLFSHTFTDVGSGLVDMTAQ